MKCSEKADGSSMQKTSKTIWCEDCNSRLVELKKQAIKYWMPSAKLRKGNYVVRSLKNARSCNFQILENFQIFPPLGILRMS